MGNMESDGNNDGEDSENEDSDDGDKEAPPKSGSDSESEGSDEENEEQEIEEILKQKIVDAKKVLQQRGEALFDALKDKNEAMDVLAALKKDQATGQKEKNAFCSLKRSEVHLDSLLSMISRLT